MSTGCFSGPPHSRGRHGKARVPAALDKSFVMLAHAGIQVIRAVDFPFAGVFAVPKVGLEQFFPDWQWWPHLGQAAKFITLLWLWLVRIKLL